MLDPSRSRARPPRGSAGVALGCMHARVDVETCAGDVDRPAPRIQSPRSSSSGPSPAEGAIGSPPQVIFAAPPLKRNLRGLRFAPPEDIGQCREPMSPRAPEERSRTAPRGAARAEAGSRASRTSRRRRRALNCASNAATSRRAGSRSSYHSSAWSEIRSDPFVLRHSGGCDKRGSHAAAHTVGRPPRHISLSNYLVTICNYA